MLVDKPAGLTSHDVISVLRKTYGQRRIGHAGTLDPEATGLLVVALGNITRLLDYFQAHSKTYVGEVVFGVETDSYDSTGSVVERYDMGVIDTERLDQAVSSMHGELYQVPPKISAIKVGGKRLYEYQRESIEVEVKPRLVRIDSLAYQLKSPNVIEIRVECGSGTYIRSIAHDLGVALGGGAHLRNLRRIRSGSFGVEEAIGVKEIRPEDVLSPVSALRDFVLVGLDGPSIAKARNGGSVQATTTTSDVIVAFDQQAGPLEEWDQVIGLYSRVDGYDFAPRVVLPTIN